MEVATGSKIGASTMIAGVVSMKQPTINSRILINIKIKKALSVALIIAFVIMFGICCMVRIFVNAVAHPKITMVVAVVEQAFPTVANKFLKSSSLCMKTPQTKA